jgi:hypothetical protein
MKKKLLFLICFFALLIVHAQTNAYKAGKKDGVWNYYGFNKSNGVLLARHFYNEGAPTGIWEFYNIQGHSFIPYFKTQCFEEEPKS